MPVQIGSTTHSFSDPTGLLTDCHRRVEMFMGVLKGVADVGDRELSDENRRALEGALRYFREAAPKHTADEEQSLFPRLRRIENSSLQSALQRLDTLEKDHRWAEPLHELADQLGTRLLQEGRLSGDDVTRFQLATKDLQEMYKHHIEIEEKEVFPAASRVLSAEAKAEIAREMKSRRG